MKYIILFLISGMAFASPSKKYVESSIVKAANAVGVPSQLLRAICFSESLLKPDAFTYSDGGSHNHAIGICQVLINTAGDYGFKDERCREDFRVIPKNNRRYGSCKLFGPYTNAFYAAKFLKAKLDSYDGSWINAISTYNSGRLKVCGKQGYYLTKRDGIKFLDNPRRKQCIPGELLNRKYVDRVLETLGDLNQ